MKSLQFETKLFWLFARRDVATTILPASTFMLITIYVNGHTWDVRTICNLLLGVFYFTLYIYPFNILNQLYGIEEDKIDKPDRPLVQGLVSINEGFFRYRLLTLGFILLGFFLGVGLWSCLWVFIVYQYNANGWDKHWFTKNVICMGLGTFAQLGAAWAIIHHHTFESYLVISTVAIWVSFTACTQDFRDILGDEQTDRKTLPIAFGSNLSRILMGGIWIILALIIGYTYLLYEGSYQNRVYVLIAASILIIVHLSIGVRLIAFRKTMDDRITYLMYSYLYGLMLLSSALILSQ
ncbi:MAG: UbiA family prenyltransferase [Bacteroidota bacterium]